MYTHIYIQPQPNDNTADLIYIFIIIYLLQILRLMIMEAIIQTKFPESFCSLTNNFLKTNK